MEARALDGLVGQDGGGDVIGDGARRPGPAEAHRPAGHGRALALEVMVPNAAIRNLIREAKVHQIYGIMQAGQKYGMQTMNQSLYGAYVNRRISYDDALGRSSDRDELLKMIGETVEV